MNSTIHFSFPTPCSRYDDFFNSNRQDGEPVYLRRRTQSDETAVSIRRDGGLSSSRRRSQFVETVEAFSRKRRSGELGLPTGKAGFSDSITFIRSEQRKTTGGTGL